MRKLILEITRNNLGRNNYYHTIFGHILNRNNQTFIKLRKIIKEYFILP
jgi:hypothetical protein